MEKFPWRNMAFHHILEQGRNSHPLLALSNFLPKDVSCVWSEEPPLGLLPESCPEMEEGPLGEHAPCCAESCEDTGSFAVLPLPHVPSMAAVPCRTLQWHWGEAVLMELNCRAGVGMEETVRFRALWLETPN